MQVWYASNNTATGEYNDLGVYYTDSEAVSFSPSRTSPSGTAGTG